MLKLSYCLWST